jgi:hypothetical protein
MEMVEAAHEKLGRNACSNRASAIFAPYAITITEASSLEQKPNDGHLDAGAAT